MIYERTVSHVYILSQGVKQKPERRTITSVLSLSQTIRHNIRTRKLISTLPLTQTIGLRTSVYHQSVSSSLQFSQTIGRNPIYLSVNDLLFHWQSIKQPKWEKIAQTLSLSQTVQGDGCKGVSNALVLGHTVIGNVVRNRTVVQDCGFVSGVSGWLSDPNFNYLNPVFTTNQKVRFTYKNVQFYLRKPEFDDKYTYDATRINRRSQGGDLLIARDNIWPAVKSFDIRFTALKQSEIDVLLNFMKLTLGKRIRYLNYDNVEWDGFITNPQTIMEQLGNCNFSVEIQFEGDVITAQTYERSITSSLNLTQDIHDLKGGYFIRQTLNFVDVVTPQQVFNRSIESTKTYGQTIAQNTNFNRSIVSNASFLHTISDELIENNLLSENDGFLLSEDNTTYILTEE